MVSPRLPDKPAPSGRRRFAVSTAFAGPATARYLLLQSWPGRLFLASTTLKLLVAALRAIVDPPSVIQFVSTAATVGLIVSVSYFVWRLFVLMRRHLLWRVRRKLILSYVFIGVVPAFLIASFFLMGGVLIFVNISAYLFKDGYDAMIDDVKLIVEAAASETSRTTADQIQVLTKYRNASKGYPGLSLAYVPVGTGGPSSVAVGPWHHTQPPAALPPWLLREVAGTIAVPAGPDEMDLVIRVAVPVTVGRSPAGFVIADLPLDTETEQKLSAQTGVKMGAVAVGSNSDDPASASATPRAPVAASGGGGALFRRSFIKLDLLSWETGTSDTEAMVSLSYQPSELYSRLSAAQQIKIGNRPLGEWLIVILVVIAGLFLIIQFVALGMGLALARSITSSIHQLFMGTERVRQGDFGHRIDIRTKDQLGDLAESFNQMTGSIEGLLQTAAEKKRLEEELRIARQIQMSLLPRGPLDVPGLGINALCVPAREVGGDYYDFFPLPGDRLGVLIADVAGKGTSAALYMAELKGVVLALSQTYDSPRDLLVEVNRVISDNLDSRSFITMTYAIIDLHRATMTYCRAGHTPLIFLRGPGSGPPAARILTPSGMVVGLRIEGAAAKFAELLEEERVDLAVGDIIVLYTDGITEAMNAASDLFGESRLSRIVEEHGHLESSELRERILREIEAFVGDADQHDDMTMILIKVERVLAASERVAV